MTLRAELEIRLGGLDLRTELSVAGGEVLAVLGPNGAGKTTLLRALAGLERIDRGRIALAGEPLDDPAAGVFVNAAERSVGFVFQDYLLFPHMTALENVAFGVRSCGATKQAAREAATRWLGTVGLVDLASSKPAAMSGGQAQRVALARALAHQPRLLLLDEPLAALDASTRATVRRDLRRHLAEFDGATVLVTHDPIDALALADRVAILERGSITQSGTLAEVTARPTTQYAADLLGVNLLRGDADGHAVRLDGSDTTVVIADTASGPTLLLLRPTSISLHHRPPDTSARNRWRCEITGFDLLGDHVRVRLTGDVDLVAEVTPAAVTEMSLAEGSPVWATAKATDIASYPA